MKFEIFYCHNAKDEGIFHIHKKSFWNLEISIMKIEPLDCLQANKNVYKSTEATRHNFHSIKLKGTQHASIHTT